MANLIDIISDYSPPSGALSVPLRSTITVEFSLVMDEEYLKKSFCLEGPDYDVVIGPDSHVELPQNIWGEHLGQMPDFLESAGYHGIVAGEITVVSGINSTILTFTPSQPLKASTEYTAHLFDVPANSIVTGAPGVGNVGNGELTFNGTWEGTSDTINLRATTSGVAGIAKFTWYMDSDPFTLHGPVLSTRRGEVLLKDGVSVKFEDGEFEVDDLYSATLTEGTVYEGHLTWTFETGTGTIIALPSTTSTSILSALWEKSDEPFHVEKTSPENREAQVDPENLEITIEFNKDIDSSSVTDDSVTIIANSATSHPAADVTANGELSKRLVVTGKTLKILL
jgi:hypothetical protein